jgi:uncharacterized membrane protein (DUF4010 family)
MATALRFGAVYAIVLLAAAWLADVAGHRGLYAAALAAGTVDIDPIALSALNLFNAADLPARAAVAMVALAYFANVAFKLAILLWFNPRLAWRALWPLAATIAAGGAVLVLAGSA